MRIDMAEQHMRECVNLGLSLRVEFSMQVCVKRRWWFDDCARERKAVTTLSFDPITGFYHFESDLHDDSRVPSQRNFIDVGEALNAALLSPHFTIRYLAAGHKRFDIRKAGGQTLVLRYRARSYCQQYYNNSIDRIARVLTLGFVRLEQYDSTWQELDRLP
jgi:hypothetical protein